MDAINVLIEDLKAIGLSDDRIDAYLKASPGSREMILKCQRCKLIEILHQDTDKIDRLDDLLANLK